MKTESPLQRRDRKTGFTLVELLVVMAIIGALLALVFPALQGARETTRRMTCSVRQYNLALATTSFHDRWNKYPGYANRVARLTTQTPFALTPEQSGPNKPASWAVVLLPYLERTDIFDLWNDPEKELIVSNSPLTFNPDMVQYLDILVCPSSGKNENMSRAANSYVSNNGFLPRSSDASPFNSPSYRSVADRSDNGIFLDRIRRTLSTTSASFLDGQSSTMIFTENLDAADWFRVGKTMNGFVWLYALEKGFAPDPSNATGTPIPAQTPPPPWARINSTINRNDENSAGFRARPSSNHSNGVNVVFADGHNGFIDQTIDYHVYQQLMTPDGKHSDMPRRSYVLKEVDYLQ